MMAFKRLLLQMARLPKRDRQWIIRQLPDSAHETWLKHRGAALLNAAQRFQTLTIDDACIPTEIAALPPQACALATQPPLYIALILTQGQFPWTRLFLTTWDAQGAIKMAMENEAPCIKPAVQQALFNAWESSFLVNSKPNQES